jgi:hypothetical protein
VLLFPEPCPRQYLNRKDSMSINVDRKLKKDGGFETDTDVEIRKLKVALKEAQEKLAAQDLRLTKLEKALSAK